MLITIVTINYNSSDNTIKLLESLARQTDKSFDVVVVENGSNDEEKRKLLDYKTTETNLIFIKNDKNLGYSGGNNVGIKKALDPPAGGGSDPDQIGASWILLLNNDTWVESDFVERIKANLDPSAGSGQGGKGGIIGLALDEGDRVAYAGQVEWLKPTLKHTYDLQPTTNDGRFYAIGGAVLIHKSVFDKIGLLDENYFLYFEDADFSLRAREAGISVSFLPDIQVHHSASSSTKKLGSPMLLRYHYRNALYFNLRHAPNRIKILLPFWSFLVAIKQLAKIVVGDNREASKAITRGILDFHLDKMGKII